MAGTLRPAENRKEGKGRLETTAQRGGGGADQEEKQKARGIGESA
jgi:hypothetical protein